MLRKKTKRNAIYPEVKLYVLEDLDCEDKFHRDTVKMQLRFSTSGVGPQMLVSLTSSLVTQGATGMRSAL